MAMWIATNEITWMGVLSAWCNAFLSDTERLSWLLLTFCVEGLGTRLSGSLYYYMYIIPFTMLPLKYSFFLKAGFTLVYASTTLFWTFFISQTWTLINWRTQTRKMHGKKVLSTVEVTDTESHQWSTAANLPQPMLVIPECAKMA